MKVGVLVLSLAVLLVGGLSFNAVAGPATDTDADGTFDVLDNCTTQASSPSPNTLDDDNDGIGNACDGDFNNDGLVNGLDVNLAGPANDLVDCITNGIPLVPAIGCDFNADGLINGLDVNNPGGTGDFLTQLGLGLPGPSGLPCAGTIPCP